jgi:predicted metalloprotease with PDZ domain
MTLADPKFISLTTIQVGKRIKDKKERVFGSASYKHYVSVDDVCDCSFGELLDNKKPF